MNDHPAHPDPRHRSLERLALLGILVLALALRLLFFSDWAEVILYSSLWGDEQNFHLTALALLGQGADPGAFLYEPFFSFYLAAVYRLAGAQPVVAHHLQLVWGLLSVFLACRLGRELAGSAAGLLSGLLVALYGPLIFLEGNLLDPGITVPLLLLSLWLYFVSERTGRLWLLLPCGVAAGLVSMARPNFLLCLPVAAVFLFRQSPRWRHRTLSLSLAALGLALGMAPAWIHNASRGEGLQPVSSAGGISFFIGNHPGARGLYQVPRGESIDADSHAAYRASLQRRAEAEEGRRLSDGKVSAYWFRRGFEFWRDHPLEALGLYFRKLLWAVNHQEAPIHHPFVFGQAVSPLLRFLPGFGTVFPFAMLGLLRAFRRRGVPLLALCAGTYALGMAAFYVADRYRILLLPMLWPLAALGMLELYQEARRGFQRRTLASLAWLLGSALLSQVPLWSSEQQRHSLSAAYNLVGKLEIEAGHTEESEEHFRRAIQIAGPEHGMLARTNLGRLLLMRGRPAEARTILEEALALDPENVQVLNILAMAAEKAGDPVLAIRCLTRLVELQPQNADIRQRLDRLKNTSSE